MAGLIVEMIFVVFSITMLCNGPKSVTTMRTLLKWGVTATLESKFFTLQGEFGLLRE